MAKPTQPKLEKYTVADAAMGYSRTVWLQRGPADRPQQLCLFLDGELYLDKMKAAPVLNEMVTRGTLPPMTFAFISHGDMKSREHDYTCNNQFGRFIAKKVVPWLEKEIPDIRPGHHLIGGLSLSGLAAAWLALQYPEHFPGCLCQSGSFWWKDEYFTKNAPQHAPVKNRFWLSVGDQETEVDDPPEVSQIVGVNHALHVLKSLGGTVHYHEYHGGHDMKYWRKELDQALHWLLNSKSD
ncbi:MAG TPA: alpha/beta hydrolase-fold protein [Candidatus Sulfotelmatobacter sp.]|nr:alpha/beta hydrolase-fold protein [Candidatus Sulfotelmatobacter sp.]